MCYSALIRDDIEKLAREFSAEVTKTLWGNVYETERSAPTKIKLPGLDNRIFPKYIAPIIRYKAKKRIIEPMYYSAYPPSYMSDTQAKQLTTFNARRESLSKRFWSEAIGVNHGLIVLKGFYEWVAVKNLVKAGVASIDDVIEEFQRQSDQRKKKWMQSGKNIEEYKPSKTELTNPMFRQIIIEFKVKSNHDLLVPVIFTSNHENSNDLNGFAIITDNPNPEIAATGHDRMPINLVFNNAEEWLQAAGCKLHEIYRLFDEQKPEYYYHNILKVA